jgi:hypothetical protein
MQGLLTTADRRSDNISEAVEKVDLIIRWRQDNKTREIIDWLYSNFWLRQADVLKQRQPGTVEWLLQDSRFLDWETGGREILWCQGSRRCYLYGKAGLILTYSAGVGKTVLS